MDDEKKPVEETSSTPTPETKTESKGQFIKEVKARLDALEDGQIEMKDLISKLNSYLGDFEDEEPIETVANKKAPKKETGKVKLF